MSFGHALSVQEAKDITKQYLDRRAWNIVNDSLETEETSLIIVLLNYGDHLVDVKCIGGEWEGKKGDLPISHTLPKCPNGHPLIEGRNSIKLGLVNLG